MIFVLRSDARIFFLIILYNWHLMIIPYTVYWPLFAYKISTMFYLNITPFSIERTPLRHTALFSIDNGPTNTDKSYALKNSRSRRTKEPHEHTPKQSKVVRVHSPSDENPALTEWVPMGQRANSSKYCFMCLRRSL